MYDSTLFFSHLDKENFRFLAGYRDLFCISIFVPGELKATEVIEQISTEMDLIYKSDPLKLENQGLDKTVEHQYMRQVRRILEEWEQHEEKKALAFFISNELMEVVQLSTSLPFKFYLSDHFYLKPIADSFNSDSEFLFVFLSSSKVKAYLVNQSSIERIGQIKDLPQQEPHKNSSLATYSKTIDKWIKEALPIDLKIVLVGSPVLIEALSNLHQTETTRFIRSIPIDSKQVTYKQIRKLTGETIRKLQDYSLKKCLRRIKEKDTPYALVSNIEKILSYSLKGKIKHLFLSKEKESFGEFDDENDFVLPLSSEENHSSLSNIAALHTIQNKGNVYLLSQEALPNTQSSINAVILR
jgi:hypothetical protein